MEKAVKKHTFIRFHSYNVQNRGTNLCCFEVKIMLPTREVSVITERKDFWVLVILYFLIWFLVTWVYSTFESSVNLGILKYLQFSAYYSSIKRGTF